MVPAGTKRTRYGSYPTPLPAHLSNSCPSRQQNPAGIIFEGSSTCNQTVVPGENGESQSAGLMENDKGATECFNLSPGLNGKHMATSFLPTVSGLDCNIHKDKDCKGKSISRKTEARKCLKLEDDTKSYWCTITTTLTRLGVDEDTQNSSS
ncbi:hypothetical protein FQN49_001968 [Arthroderma sp. PD_2]|nr:hypothetical protein FQN49_001968 [Arthroderma sp. PD_2]